MQQLLPGVLCVICVICWQFTDCVVCQCAVVSKLCSACELRLGERTGQGPCNNSKLPRNKQCIAEEGTAHPAHYLSHVSNA